MAFEGMDVEVVSGLHTQMNNLCQQLQGIAAAMPGLVSNLEGAWKGPDAQQFAAQWPSHQAQLQSAVNALHEICTITQANILQQQQASNSL
jgi:uncharacterized protein YukE